jgi:molybdate transport system ATP-binding protein
MTGPAGADVGVGDALAVAVAGDVGGGLAIDVAFRATGGAPVAIVGPNGAGKTSVLRMILGALRPARGTVVLGGTPLYDRERGVDLPIERRALGYVPQNYGLFPHLTAIGNVMYGLAALPAGERREAARAVMQELGIDGLADRRPRALSGGEAQRVALARALARRPRALLLDEPLAALDVGVRRAVRRSLARDLARLALPTVLVTHDIVDAVALASTIVVVEAGRVVQTGTPAELAAAPATAFVEELTTAGTI